MHDRPKRTSALQVWLLPRRPVPLATGPRCWMHDKDVVAFNHRGDRDQVMLHIVVELEQCRRHGDWQIDRKQKGVAVWKRSHDCLSSDTSSCARERIDHDGLLQILREFVSG